jgi:hypothetical protein
MWGFLFQHGESEGRTIDGAAGLASAFCEVRMEDLPVVGKIQKV